MKRGFLAFLPGLLVLAACACGGPATRAARPAPGAGPPPSGTVGNDGGKVNRLFFATTGDTRPASCDASDQYPRETIAQLAAAMKGLRVQFALDLGDHMFVCNGSRDEARQQMGFYMTAIAAGPPTWWMTMGNHECGSAYRGTGCAVGTPDANFEAYLAALRRPRPWYATSVQTDLGLARIVVVADDAWGDEQAAWLETTLADADAHARVTIVARHHPATGSRTGNASALATIERHKYTLLLTAHSHTYERDSERSVMVGLGGAPSIRAPGFGTVLENPDGSLSFVLHDLSGNPVGEPWSVAAQ